MVGMLARDTTAVMIQEIEKEGGRGILTSCDVRCCGVEDLFNIDCRSFPTAVTSSPTESLFSADRNSPNFSLLTVCRALH